MTSTRLLTLAVAAALSLPALPAQAGTASDPEVTDRVGDAYFVNGQGQINDLEETAPSAHPGSISSADLVAIWFETTYATITERDAAGGVVAVRHVANGVDVNIETAASAKPTFGPGVVMSVPGSVGGCNFNIELWVSGAGSGTALERPEGANISPIGCPDLTRGDGTLTFDGKVTRAHLPFAATSAVFRVGAELNPHPTSKPHVRTQFGATAPVVDEAKRGRPFVIGSDVPPNVVCSETPDDPACAG